MHARSVVAAAIDGETGEAFRARLTPDYGQVVRWVQGLPGPAAVAYEAGPTGFGLARAFGVNGQAQVPAGGHVKVPNPCG